MIAHGNRSAPHLLATPSRSPGYVRVHLGPGRQMAVPELAVRRWRATVTDGPVVVDAEGREASDVEWLAQRRQAAFIRFARALLQAEGVPDVTARLTELAAAIRWR